MKKNESKPPWKIRKAREADFTALYDLQLKAYHTEDLLYEYTIPPLLQSREEAVEDCCQASLVLVAINEKKEIIGSVRGVLEQQVCTISKLMVDPAWRRRGVGTGLLCEIETRLPAKKWRLFTGTKSRNNIHLYQKNGYKTVHTDPEKELIYLGKEALVVKYLDHFEDEPIGESPSHWQENRTADTVNNNWIVYEKKGNKVYGTAKKSQYTASWLHIFEKDPDISMKFMVEEIRETAQIGFTIRRAPDTAFVDIVYVFCRSQWQITSQESESTGAEVVSGSVESKIKLGQWYSIRIIADGGQVLVYLDGSLVVQADGIKRMDRGRTGVFSQGAAFFIDDVECVFKDGDIPQDGVLSYVIIPDTFSHFLEIEGFSDEKTLVGIGHKRLISYNAGLTWDDITCDAEWSSLYNKWYTSLLKLRSSKQFTQIIAGTAFQVSDDLRQWTTIGQIVPCEEQLDGLGRTCVVTHVNSTTEIKMEDGSYRVFCPVGFRRFDDHGNIMGHYTKIYFSDDSGKTWRCSRTTTKELLPGYSDKGNTTWCESKVIRCADNSLRLYYSRNYLGCMQYTVSHDCGETWEGLYQIPEMQNAMTSYAIIEDYSQCGTFYMLRLDGTEDFLGSIVPRNHITLLKSTDGINWEFLMHCEWMSSICSPKNHSPLYQILDPSLFVTNKYLYITYGISEREYSSNESPHHQSQRCYYMRVEKDKLVARPWDETTIASMEYPRNLKFKVLPKTRYKVGELFDYSDGIIEITALNGRIKTERVNADYTVYDELNMFKPGKQTIRMVYKNGYSLFYDIEILDSMDTSR